MSRPELYPSALDIRRTSIAQLDRGFCECDVLEMPAPSDVDLRSGYEPTDRDTCAAAILSRTGRGELIRTCKRDAKCLAGNRKRDQRAR